MSGYQMSASLDSTVPCSPTLILRTGGASDDGGAWDGAAGPLMLLVDPWAGG